MEQRKFSEFTPYIFANDVSPIVIQKIKESYSQDGFADIVTDTVRTYENGSMAAHILGRTGVIYAEEYEKLKDKGYGMNDIIGKDGLEAVLEPYLKGKDGYKKIRVENDGRFGQIADEKSVESGCYAELTLDNRLQKITEQALRRYIPEAAGSDGAGAAVAVDPKTGEILAIASYPSYDPETFNMDYDKLIEKKSNPIFNRALNGAYALG